MGFNGSKVYASLFTYGLFGLNIFVHIYIDDIVITSSKPDAIYQLFRALQADFAIKDLGPLHFFLGIEAT
jgi:hypothetical protein